MQGKSKTPAADGSSAPQKGNVSGVQRIGKRSLRFYQKDSQEILEGINEISKRRGNNCAKSGNFYL